MHVAERPRDADVTGDPGFVEAGETAADHAGGGAVPTRARAAEAEAGPAGRLDRVDGSAEDGTPVDVRARVELELGHEVAPVGRQRFERRLPLGLERRARDLGRRLGLARSDETQLAGDSLRVDPAEQTPRGLGSD